MATKYLVDDAFEPAQPRSVLDEHMPTEHPRFVGERKKTITFDTGFGFKIETSVPPVAGLVEAFERLYELRALAPDWDTYGAAAVHRDTFKPAVEILGHALNRCHQPFITAVNTGGLKLAWECEQRELDLEVEPSGGVNIYFCDDLTGEEIEKEAAPIDEAISVLHRFCRGE